MPMIAIGSTRLPAPSRNGPIANPCVDQHGREADRKQIDGERPDDVEHSREDRVDNAAEEAGDDARSRASRHVISAAKNADQQRVAPAVEQPRRHVASLVVGAEEVVVRIPGRPDRSRAEAEPSGRLPP